MNNLKTILTEITQLTNTIKNDYPELYQFLDEDPMTIPVSNHPHINKQIMQEYLEGLKQILKKYMKSHIANTSNK